MPLLCRNDVKIMGSTFPSTIQPAGDERVTAPLRWRTWPLGHFPRWSWLLPLSILAVGAAVFYLGNSWAAAFLAAGGFAATLWQLLFPVSYEIHSLGLRRSALGRTRLLPWHAVQSYDVRATGIVLYQSSNPGRMDVLRSIFVPYPADEDELLVAIRQYLPHATELQP